MLFTLPFNSITFLKTIYMEQSETKPKRKIFEVAEKKEEYTPKKKRPKWIKTNKY